MERTTTALLRDGRKFTADFGGFIEASNVLGLKKVKLLNVLSLCRDVEGLGLDFPIPDKHYVVGTYHQKQLFVLLFDNEPKHFKLDEPDVPKRVNVVVDIFKR